MSLENEIPPGYPPRWVHIRFFSLISFCTRGFGEDLLSCSCYTIIYKLLSCLSYHHHPFGGLDSDHDDYSVTL